MSSLTPGRWIKCGVASMAAFICIGGTVAAPVVTSNTRAQGNPWG
jgi:hypothetical protein